MSPTLKQRVRRLLGRDLQHNITREVRRALAGGAGDPAAPLVLPIPCGVGLPERVVELIAAWRSYRPGLAVLDVGHAHIMECHRDLLRALPAPRRLTGIDIAEPIYDASRFYAASVRGSVTAMTFADASFDRVWCISALEHFGMDNSGYTPEFVADESLANAAMAEMFRVLEPGGELLLTLPYGRYENHGWFRNFDAEHLAGLLEPFRERARIRQATFRHTRPNGWAEVPAGSLGEVGYAGENNAGAAACVIVWLTRER